MTKEISLIMTSEELALARESVSRTILHFENHPNHAPADKLDKLNRLYDDLLLIELEDGILKPDEVNQLNFDRLVAGQSVTFSKVPLGSWITPNEPYVVEWKSADSAYFRNPRTGGGTYDMARDINLGEILDIEV